MATKNSHDGHNTARIIEIEGKRFAAGLWWHPLKEGANRKKEIAKFAQSEDQNMVAVHSTSMGDMAGFAKAEGGELKFATGAWALAPVLADSLGDSWIGVFSLEDGNSVLIAINDGAVVPGCDIVADFETVRDRFIEMSHVYTWQRVYVMDEALAELFDSSIVQALELKDAVAFKKWDKEYKLRSLEQSLDPRIVFVGFVVAIAFGGFYGWNKYQTMLEEQLLEHARLEAQVARQARDADRRIQALKTVESQTIQPSWYDAPPATQMLMACSKGIDSLPLTIAGWTLSGATCSGGRVRGTYERFIGTTIQDFYQAADKHRLAGTVSSINAMPDKGTVTINLSGLDPRGHEDILDEGPWIREWIAHFQSLHLDSILKHKPHPEPPVPDKSIVDLIGPEKAVPPPPWWTTHEWSYKAEAMRPEQVLSAIPGQGLEIKSVELKLDKDGWQWSAKGEIHVQ